MGELHTALLSRKNHKQSNQHPHRTGRNRTKTLRVIHPSNEQSMTRKQRMLHNWPTQPTQPSTDSKLIYITGHKSILKKKEAEIIPCLLLEHREIQVVINRKRNYENSER